MSSWAVLPHRVRSLLVAERPSRIVCFGAAAVMLSATAAVQLWLFSASAPWFLYTPVVIVTLLFGGGAGLLATLMAALAAGYAVTRPGYPLLLLPVHWAASLVFTLTTIALVGLVLTLRTALRESDALRAERELALADTARREAFLASVLAASTDCIKVVELDGTLSFMSEGGMKVMDVSDFNDVRGCPWPDFLKEDGPGAARQALDAARQGRSSSFEALADTYIGTPKFWSISVSPITGPDGGVERILSVSRDHTALEEARRQQRLLNDELSHRLKNTLGVVQAIALQTLGRSVDQEALAGFSDRLKALSAAHDVLSRQSWSAATLGEVAESVLATFDEGSRLELDGPEVVVGPRAALAASLLLHELATNATKYGALSAETGCVALGWKIAEDDGREMLELCWRERGGPPATEPKRRGFGSRIIAMGLSGSGGVSLRYEERGLTAEIVAPLAQIQEA